MNRILAILLVLVLCLASCSIAEELPKLSVYEYCLAALGMPIDRKEVALSDCLTIFYYSESRGYETDIILHYSGITYTWSISSTEVLDFLDSFLYENQDFPVEMSFNSQLFFNSPMAEQYLEEYGKVTF